MILNNDNTLNVFPGAFVLGGTTQANQWFMLSAERGALTLDTSDVVIENVKYPYENPLLEFENAVFQTNDYKVRWGGPLINDTQIVGSSYTGEFDILNFLIKNGGTQSFYSRRKLCWW